MTAQRQITLFFEVNVLSFFCSWNRKLTQARVLTFRQAKSSELKISLVAHKDVKMWIHSYSQHCFILAVVSFSFLIDNTLFCPASSPKSFEHSDQFNCLTVLKMHLFQFHQLSHNQPCPLRHKNDQLYFLLNSRGPLKTNRYWQEQNPNYTLLYPRNTKYKADAVSQTPQHQ